MSSIIDSSAGGSSRRSWLKKLGGVLGGGFLLGKSQAAAAARPQSVAAPQGFDPFFGEIMLVSFAFAPKGWALCNGQLLPIAQNAALFSLLGTQYGGNGTTNFALPDLRGRVLAYAANGQAQGQKGGEETHVLLAAEMPPHLHGLASSTAPGTTALSGTTGPTVHHYLADSGVVPQYGSAATINTALANSPAANPPVNVSSVVGTNQPHENRQPYLCLNYVIALTGIYPSRN